MALDPRTFTEPDRRTVTDPARHLYDVRELESLNAPHVHPDLVRSLDRPIRHFSVEFINMDLNNVKPHLAFRFNFGDDGEFTSCRMSMDTFDAADGAQGGGACVIKLCNYRMRSEAASAGFEFACHPRLTLRTVVAVMLGTYNGLPLNYRSNLRIFRFVEIPQPNSHFEPWDGCRDWL
jgi:hypothetical protein